MAKITAIPAARVALVLSLSTLMSACSLMGSDKDEAVAVSAVSSTSTNSTELTMVEGRIDVPQNTRSREDEISEDAPQEYTVVKGDTLWDISDRFLNKAWLWPKVWDYNPQIDNPHLIFPGDVVSIEYVNGLPRFIVERDGARVSYSDIGGNSDYLDSVRISPQIRVESLEDAIPMIPGDAIASFLVHPRVIAQEQIDNAPYIVGNYDGRLISAIGHQIYARGELNREQPQYSVFRKSKKLIDPVTKNVLGFEVQHVSDAKLMHLGDPSTLMITANNMETIVGDFLLSTNDDSVATSYDTRMPILSGGDGRVVSLVNAITQSGRDQVIVLNLGKKNMIQPGDVLAIESSGGTLNDPRGKVGDKTVDMPNTRTGVVMVFKTFDDVSYALVMESTLPVRVNDGVTGI